MTKLKSLTITISTCIQCVHCCEDMPKDWCINDNNGQDGKPREISNKYDIPSWCPLNDATGLNI